MIVITRRGGLALAMLLAPAIASAQHMGHAGMQMPMQQLPAPPTDKKPPPSHTPGHADHANPKRKTAPAKRATTHEQEEAQPPAGATSEATQMPAMRMDMPMDHTAMDNTQNVAPRTPIPVLTDADRAAAMPPHHDHPVHDNPIEMFTVFNRLEGWNANPGSGFSWEGSSWIGTDLNRLWLRTEGAQVDGRLQDADIEVLYGHSIAPWWDVLTGVRHDFKPGESQDFAALGVQGLAPYKFEVAATAYVGEAGQTSARFEAEYELLLTNRLILQPLLEINLFGQSDARRDVGSGLSTIESGLRLRYEMTRRFAPYIGVVQERAYGQTASLRRTDGEDTNQTRIVAGVRIWF
jgi:copper resistance protein B